MNILLLGNGFDLNHQFPTTYIDFMITTRFLLENYDQSMKTVGDIFGDERLKKQSQNIELSYEEHKSKYHHIALSRIEIEELIEKAEKNCWYDYFSKMVNKDIGWIDFEKEIVKVLKSFRHFFKTSGLPLKTMDDMRAAYIVNQFSFFSTIKTEEYVGNYFWGLPDIKHEYQRENPAGSGFFEIDQKNIIEDLLIDLKTFADMLRLYLSCFVESVLEEMRQMGYRAQNRSLPNKVEYVFTFNYTTTYESLNEKPSITHIHGDVLNDIILGVNPDENDELSEIDTSFIKFKKYFQRTILGTDAEFRMVYSHLVELQNHGYENDLYVIGHSLDVTDEDIIKKLFDLSSNIVIFYHNKNAMESHISNLITMYGKSDYDALALEKNIQFKLLEKTQWGLKEEALLSV